MLAEVEGLEVGRLSEGQKDCLRLVLAHKTSKEIARYLGISSHTVDQRLRYAIRTLGARTRMQAALKLSDAERQQEGSPADTNPDVQYGHVEVQDVTSPTIRLMHQSRGLPHDAVPGSPFVRRSAFDPEALRRFASSTGEMAETPFEDDAINEFRVRSEPTPALEPRPAGELSKAGWPQEIHLRWHHKLLAILVIGIMLIMAAGSLVVGIEALSHLLD